MNLNICFRHLVLAEIVSFEKTEMFETVAKQCKTMYITLVQSFCPLVNRSAGGSLLIPS